MSSRNSCPPLPALRPPEDSDHAGPIGSSPASALMSAMSVSSISMSVVTPASSASFWISGSFGVWSL
eukprot:13427004-Alexandrium_andersonii.AAC.1